MSHLGLAFLAVAILAFSEPIAAQEIKRALEMSYVCSRDASGNLTLAKIGQRQAFPITAWAEPIQQEYSYNNRKVVLELYDFRFRCGAGGEIHITDLYLASPAAQRWKAHRRGDSLAITAGTKQVLTSHRVSECHKIRDLSEYGRCLETGDRYSEQESWNIFPPNTSPLPDIAKVNNKASLSPGIGVDAGAACKRFPNLC